MPLEGKVLQWAFGCWLCFFLVEEDLGCAGEFWLWHLAISTRKCLGLYGEVFCLRFLP